MAIARMVTIFMLVCWRGQLSGRICIHGQKTLRSTAILIPTCFPPTIAELTLKLSAEAAIPSGCQSQSIDFFVETAMCTSSR